MGRNARMTIRSRLMKCGLRPSPRRALRVAGIGLALAGVACAWQDTSQLLPSLSETSADRLFAVGYQDISDIYIEDVPVSELAISGLSSLSSMDPSLAINRNGELVTVNVAGHQAGALDAPKQEDISAWGSLTAAALNLGRNNSEALSSAEAEAVYETVFDGIVARLDSFSRYAGRSEARENRASRDGFGGIGVRIRLVEQGIKIISVMEDTPAEEAGLQAADVITHINGAAATGITQHEAVSRLRGPIHSTVYLIIERADRGQPLPISVTRSHVVPQTVTYRAEGNIGYIRISGFNQSTARKVRQKVKFAKQQLAQRLAGFVLDLRGNPGGLLDQAVAVSDLFIRKGQIVSTHGRHPDSHQYFDAEPDDVTEGLPLAVLVNGNSASASEIVAAALQDTRRAVIIGSNSYGKGTVQTVLRLPNDGELTLTWARFHAPSGYALDQRGVLPDVCTSGDVANSAEVISRLRRGLYPLAAAKLWGAVDVGNGTAIQALRDNCPMREDEPELDLEVALTLLTDLPLYELAMGRRTITPGA